jgi:uncharacterized protein (TIGR02265 family)
MSPTRMAKGSCAGVPRRYALPCVSDRREAVPESNRKIYGRWINGFFESIKPAGAFAQELREAGYDAAQPAAHYPVRTFYNLMEVARRHLFPGLPEAESHRKLGRRLVTNQFERGIGGKLWAKAFPLLGPDRLLKGVGQLTHSGGDNLLEITW